MLFNSITFLIFFIVVFLVMRIRWPWRWRKLFLLLASYYFYAAWNPPFVLILILSTVADFYVAQWIGKASSLGAKRLLIGASLILNLGLLFYFKYGAFLLDNISGLLAVFGLSHEFKTPNIILPAGISFYTFLTLSYTLDVYWGRIKAWNSLLDYGVYVTFFPHLIAGPILRADFFLPQCRSERRASSEDLSWGFALFIFGLFQKVVIADNLMAPIVEQVFDVEDPLPILSAWAGLFAFSVQIFCDFSGYSTCAIGLAGMLGFSLPINFKYPYGAIGFSDFWRRWHISLSTWLRDYLYIPLGGSRSGQMRTYLNLMITMLLGGLWHGASWMFVIWGGLHGLYLAIEKWFSEIVHSKEMAPPSLFVKTSLSLFTTLLVCFTWIFFRSRSLEGAVGMILSLTGHYGADISHGKLLIVVAGPVFAALFIIHQIMRDRNLRGEWCRLGWLTRGILLGFAIFFIISAFTGEDRAFIYFQF